MKKLLYVHGLGSGQNSRTAQVLQNNLEHVQVFSPEIPEDPEDAYNFLVNFYRKNVPDIIVGTSLGGFYTSLIGGCIKVLINPALVPHENIRDYFGIGTYSYFSERLDGSQYYYLTEEFYQKLEKLYNHFHEECLDEEFRCETYAIIGYKDRVINPLRSTEFFLKHYSTKHLMLYPDIEHRPTEDELRRLIIPFINNLIGE